MGSGLITELFKVLLCTRIVGSTEAEGAQGRGAAWSSESCQWQEVKGRYMCFVYMSLHCTVLRIVSFSKSETFKQHVKTFWFKHLSSLLTSSSSDVCDRYCWPPYLHLATSEMWCWSGGRGI